MKAAAEFSGSANLQYSSASCSAGVLVLKLNAISLVFKRNFDWKCYCSSLRFYFLDDGPHKIFKQEKFRYFHAVKEKITSVTADLISCVVRLSASLDLSTVFSPLHCTLLMLLGLSFLCVCVCVAVRCRALLFRGFILICINTVVRMFPIITLNIVLYQITSFYRLAHIRL